jgi:hypothetical protein
VTAVCGWWSTPKPCAADDGEATLKVYGVRRRPGDPGVLDPGGGADSRGGFPDELAVDEGGAGTDQRHEMGCVDAAPPLLWEPRCLKCHSYPATNHSIRPVFTSRRLEMSFATLCVPSRTSSSVRIYVASGSLVICVSRKKRVFPIDESESGSLPFARTTPSSPACR